MPNHLISQIKIGLAVLCAVFLSANLAATPAWGADQSAADATLTMDVNNEPLGSVLGKITQKTSWKIKAPDKWLDKPVTQTLNNATLEEGLRSVLNNAGIENLLLMYDENIRVVTIFDTESAQKQAAATSPARANVLPPAVNAPPEPDPKLQRLAKDPEPRPARGSRRARTRSSEDD